MSNDRGPDVVRRFLAAVEGGAIAGTSDIWGETARLDATVPQWRFQREGVAAIRAEYAGWFAAPGRFESLRTLPTPDGEVGDYVLTWTENGVPHAAHHVHLLTVQADRIVADTVMCGGRWPADLLAQMEAADA